MPHQHRATPSSPMSTRIAAILPQADVGLAHMSVANRICLLVANGTFARVTLKVVALGSACVAIAMQPAFEGTQQERPGDAVVLMVLIPTRIEIPGAGQPSMVSVPTIKASGLRSIRRRR